MVEEAGVLSSSDPSESSLMTRTVEVLAAPNLAQGGTIDDLAELVARLETIEGAEILQLHSVFVVFKAPETDTSEVTQHFDGKLLFELNNDLQLDPPAADFGGGPAGPGRIDDPVTNPPRDDEEPT